jgi:hypothetical protein
VGAGFLQVAAGSVTGRGAGSIAILTVGVIALPYGQDNSCQSRYSLHQGLAYRSSAAIYLVSGIGRADRGRDRENGIGYCQSLSLS